MTQQEAPEKPLGEALSGGLRSVWLAGLGVVVTAGESGSKLFHTLVEKGEAYEPEGRERLKALSVKVSQAVDSAGETVATTFKDVSRKARAMSSRVEAVVEEKVSAALTRYGVPTRDEFQSLTRRLDEIAVRLNRLEGKARARKRAVTRGRA